MGLTDKQRIQMINLAVSRYNVLNGGSTPPEPTGEHRVRWIDYDGTVLKEEWLNAGDSATPPLDPIHDHLTFQEWNHLPSEYSLISHDLDIGAIYKTTSGKTEYDIYIDSIMGLGFQVSINIYAYQTATVDWGDGSLPESKTVSSSEVWEPVHTYSSPGFYTISIDCTGDFSSPCRPAYHNNKYIHARISENNKLFKYGAYPYAIFDEYKNLKTITLPNNIGDFTLDESFNECRSLEAIILPRSVTQIAHSPFNNCYRLKNVSLPNTITGISSYGFYQCGSLESIVLPDSLTMLSNSLLGTCWALNRFHFSPNISAIGDSCFIQVNFKKVTLPEGLPRLNRYVFSGNRFLKEIKIPSTVTMVDYMAFANCTSLETVELQEGLLEIYSSAFMRCYSLPKITIPSTVTKIWNYAFQYCYSLKEVTVLSPTPPAVTFSNNLWAAFSSGHPDIRIKVPASSVAAYKAAPGWSEYAIYIVAI